MVRQAEISAVQVMWAAWGHGATVEMAEPWATGVAKGMASWEEARETLEESRVEAESGMATAQLVGMWEVAVALAVTMEGQVPQGAQTAMEVGI